ncbi:FkbM family methyltransferase [Gammaproteobacteria bacterium]|jgi:FkbM family methyltransferase|nr:FkbM family methyltransferase [Gammaproteobacteria bacterium]
MELLTQAIKNIIKIFFSWIGVQIVPHDALLKIESSNHAQSVIDLNFFRSVCSNHFSEAINILPFSYSQLRQDIYVLTKTNFKANGFFVEFGACDGIELSNTHLLEKKFNWTGILAEPARSWLGDLAKNRDCIVVNKCVWKESNKEVLFNEVGELSTISKFRNKDMHADLRKIYKEYSVTTISLNDLLIQNCAPSFIDYLSIDTEGSEFDILSAIDFHKFSFGIITVEHNFSANREKIYRLLTENGYRREFEVISNFDDWYIKI